VLWCGDAQSSELCQSHYCVVIWALPGGCFCCGLVWLVSSLLQTDQAEYFLLKLTVTKLLVEPCSCRSSHCGPISSRRTRWRLHRQPLLSCPLPHMSTTSLSLALEWGRQELELDGHRHWFP
jgi:hypothetical protein